MLKPLTVFRKLLEMANLLTWKQFFEAPFLETKLDKEGNSIKHENYTYVCSLCKAKKKLNKHMLPVSIKVHGSTTSNLIIHVTENHPIEANQFIVLKADKKRKESTPCREHYEDPNSPSTPAAKKSLNTLFNFAKTTVKSDW
jgi:hypothetical protein